MSARLNLVVALAALGLFAGSADVLAKSKDKEKDAGAVAATKPAVNPACGTDKLTKKLEKSLGAAQKAQAAKDFNGMLTHVAEAEAAGPETESPTPISSRTGRRSPISRRPTSHPACRKAKRNSAARS